MVDIDLESGADHVVGTDGNVASVPGSALKPMVLLIALRLGVITPQTRIACTGSLRIAGRNLACSHPVGLGVLDAEEALAYSCNTYFARVAQQLPSAALHAGLQRYGVFVAASLGRPEDRALVALGLEGVSVTPLQLARAYTQLARDLEIASTEDDTVRRGLLGSVEYGMAHAAKTPGMVLGGKTGTAHDPAPLLQHGWFAGMTFAPGTPIRPMRVVAVYVPGGTGNDAAGAAHRYLERKR